MGRGGRGQMGEDKRERKDRGGRRKGGEPALPIKIVPAPLSSFVNVT